MLYRHWLRACRDGRREAAMGIDFGQQCRNSLSLANPMRMAKITRGKTKAVTADYYAWLINRVISLDISNRFFITNANIF